jgi:hypothetical protein
MMMKLDALRKYLVITPPENDEGFVVVLWSYRLHRDVFQAETYGKCM